MPVSHIDSIMCSFLTEIQNKHTDSGGVATRPQTKKTGVDGGIKIEDIT